MRCYASRFPKDLLLIVMTVKPVSGLHSRSDEPILLGGVYVYTFTRVELCLTLRNALLTYAYSRVYAGSAIC